MNSHDSAMSKLPIVTKNQMFSFPMAHLCCRGGTQIRLLT